MLPSPIVSKWNFLSRTISGVGELLVDIEQSIRQKFIPSLLKTEISDDVRELLALPARFAGLGIFNPTERPLISFDHSVQLCAPLVSLILRQADTFEPDSLLEEQKLIRVQQEAALDYQYEHAISRISMKSPNSLQRAIAVASSARKRSIELAHGDSQHRTRNNSSQR